MEDVCRAVVCMLQRIRHERFEHHPYHAPFLNYTATWINCLPLKTIIIGQNPYPQDVYPTRGAALSFSPRHDVPVSVQNIAKDLHHTNGVAPEDTVECFMNLWELIDSGVLAINRSIFGSICKDSSGNDASREMEEQTVVIQEMMKATVKMQGPSSFTCIAMGNQAHAMAVSLKSWANGTTIKIKVIKSLNPAARRRRDTGSQQDTLDSAAASKALSGLVNEYMSQRRNMAGPSDPTRERSVAKLEEFQKSNAVLENSFGDLMRECESLSSRLLALRSSNASGEPVSVDDAALSLESFRDSLSTASAHTQMNNMMMRELVNSLFEYVDKSKATMEKNKGSSTPKAAGTMSPRVSTTSAFDRVPSSARQSSRPSPITEVETPVTPAQGALGARVLEDTASTTQRTTVAASGVSVTTNNGAEMSRYESVLMTKMSKAISDKSGSDIYSNEIRQCANRRVCAGSVTASAVLAHIREQMDKDDSWDPSDEMEDETTDTYQWVENFVKSRRA